jgi:hypothetical protein
LRVLLFLAYRLVWPLRLRQPVAVVVAKVVVLEAVEVLAAMEVADLLITTLDRRSRLFRSF